MGYKSFIRKLAKFILTSQPEKIVKVEIAQINYGAILKNKRIVITGGSKGLGYVMAKKCIKEGAEVIITGRNEEKLKKACNELGEKCQYIIYDITKIQENDVFLKECLRKFNGQINCLINNAGISCHENHIFKVTEDTFDRQFDTNLKGSYFLAQNFLKNKNKIKNFEQIIFISSESAEQCYDIPYGMTKSSINTLVGALSRRFYQEGIRINAIAPGVTATDMTKEYADISDGNLYRDCASERVFLPEEVAELVCFILSDAARCISGEVIHCNAGNHLNPFWK